MRQRNIIYPAIVTSEMNYHNNDKAIETHNCRKRSCSRFMLKGSFKCFIPTFPTMVVLIYVKTLGKSGVNLHFYALQSGVKPSLPSSPIVGCLTSPRYCYMHEILRFDEMPDEALWVRVMADAIQPHPRPVQRSRSLCIVFLQGSLSQD
jgi:hypothetical protein